MSSRKISRPRLLRIPTARDAELGREIAGLRRVAKLVQSEVADDLGISEMQYGKYERGQTPMLVTVYERIKAHLLKASTVTAPRSGFEEDASPYLTAKGQSVDHLLLSKIAELRRVIDDIDRYAHSLSTRR